MIFFKKIKLLYIPFLLTAIGMWILYTFLNWLFVIHLEVLSIKEVIVNFGLPLALPWIPILFYIKPKLKLLKLTTKGGHSWMGFYLVMLWIILFVPATIAQHYIQTATGKLTQLQNITEIDSLPKTKYYTVKEFYIEKKNIGTHTSFEVTGKHNENFNINIYVAVPMYRNYVDTTHVISWLGLTYSKRIGNNLEQKEKEDAYEAFAEESQKEFDDVDLNAFVYLSRVPNSDEREGLNEALKKSSMYKSTNTAHFFLSVNELFKKRNGSKGIFLTVTSILGAVIWLLTILTTEFDKKALQLYEAGKLNAKEDVNEFIDYIKPKERFFITPIIMYLNVGIFLVMFFMGLGFMSFESEDLIVWGANYGPLTAHGEWWRLLTSTFLHGGFMHLAANMYGLLFVGIFLEPVLGKMKYLGIYLITGIIASGVSLWWNDTVVSIGASGAIFGLYGALLALLITGVFPKEMGKAFMVSTMIFVGYNLVVGLVIGIFGNGTDNAAHIGGLVSGFLIGLALYPMLKGTVKFD